MAIVLSKQWLLLVMQQGATEVRLGCPLMGPLRAAEVWLDCPLVGPLREAPLILLRQVRLHPLKLLPARLHPGWGMVWARKVRGCPPSPIPQSF